MADQNGYEARRDRFLDEYSKRNIRGALQEALTDPNVVDRVQAWPMMEDEGGFLLYVNDGQVYVGDTVVQDRSLLRQYQGKGLGEPLLDSGQRLQRWTPFATQEFDSYMDAFLSLHSGCIDSENGTLVLTKWRLHSNELDQEITRKLSDSETLQPATKLGDVATLNDYLELNKLRLFHDRPVLVRGQIPLEDTPYVRLSIRQQRSPMMDIGQLHRASLYEIVADHRRDEETMEKVQPFYRKMRGLLDLNERSLDLEVL